MSKRPDGLAVTLRCGTWRRIARACRDGYGHRWVAREQWARCQQAGLWIAGKLPEDDAVHVTLEAPVDSWCFAASVCVQVGESAGRGLSIALSDHLFRNGGESNARRRTRR